MAAGHRDSRRAGGPFHALAVLLASCPAARAEVGYFTCAECPAQTYWTPTCSTGWTGQWPNRSRLSPLACERLCSGDSSCSAWLIGTDDVTGTDCLLFRGQNLCSSSPIFRATCAKGHSQHWYGAVKPSSAVTADDTCRLRSVEGRKRQAASCVSTYQQCGGNAWTGETTCCDPAFECAAVNTFYQQCKPKTPSPPPPTPPPPPPPPCADKASAYKCQKKLGKGHCSCVGKTKKKQKRKCKKARKKCKATCNAC